MYFNIQQQEDAEYEDNARFDYLAEAYAGEDLAQFNEDDYAAMEQDAAEEAARLGIFDAHVGAWRVHKSALRFIDRNPEVFADIPF